MKRRQSRDRRREFTPKIERTRSPNRDLIDAAPTREILTAARVAGMTWVAMANAAGISDTAVKEIASGERKRITPVTAQKVASARLQVAEVKA